MWEAADFANALAALSVQKIGTTPSMPRVIVFGMTNESMARGDFKAKVKDIDVLSDLIRSRISKAKIHNDLDKIVVIQEVDREQTQEEYRKNIKKIAEQVQGDVARYNKYLKIKAGAGRVVDGIINLPGPGKGWRYTIA